ncbi:grass carp reovirus (GCRV)-induced gene 2e [Sebastes umbrosus]|uniref:grass carp reovirus (GCRV)-induced gene 2e n=1 Tax=Sebastes umbrosus TaxID=72105 RepID=UPI00189F2EAB|nr:grass carp reovirus (GCRV)-induced gene 2e [Sebastes umbrosus]
MQYEWAEDDFDVPDGVVPLGLSAPSDNRKYVMYHGTTKESANLILAKGFRQSPGGMLGRGVYLSRDLKKASRYPIGHPESDKVVIKVKVNVGKVIAINHQYHPYRETWHDYGYDTAWVPPNCGMVKSGLEEDCVWDPERINILNIINPRPVKPSSGYGARGYKCDTETKMQYVWAEDDFVLPYGVFPLGVYAPCDDRNYVMYHGTTRENATLILKNGFLQSPGGMLGRGVYLSRDLQKASRYPLHHPEYDKVVITVGVNVGKVIAINHQKHPYRETWHYYGYDTAWVPPNCGMVKSGLEEDCVWDPNRIQILNTINPRPVQGGYCAWCYMNTVTNMQYEWAEDDFALPYGVVPLGISAPCDNNNYAMYHGTTRENATLILKNGFLQSPGGMLGRGVYLSRDLQKASRYPIGHPEHDKVVIKVWVNVGKVIIINHQNHPYQKTWHDYGYDTAWVPPNCGMVKSGLEEHCVWGPNRIKILKTINPRPVQGGNSAWGSMNTVTNMQYEWAEDDFDLPYGVVPLGISAPGDNRNYIMYHGTTKSNAQVILTNGFSQSTGGMLGRGVYLSRDLQKASRYPIGHPEYDKVVIKVKVNVGRVIAINHQYHPKQKTWHDYGYDTAWVPPNCGMVKSGLEEDCVWDPNRIKILKTINPRPVQGGNSAWGYM